MTRRRVLPGTKIRRRIEQRIYDSGHWIRCTKAYNCRCDAASMLGSSLCSPSDFFVGHLEGSAEFPGKPPVRTRQLCGTGDARVIIRNVDSPYTPVEVLAAVQSPDRLVRANFRQPVRLRS